MSIKWNLPVSMIAGALCLVWPSLVLSTQSQPVYVLAIGNNAPPAFDPSQDLHHLRYADDDAVAMVDFWSHFTKKRILLSVLDEETQRRFPHASHLARPPSVWELKLAVERLRKQLRQERRAGNKPVVIIYFSGHGAINRKKGAYLSLFDGALNRSMLYNQILARLPASYIHLIVDACHAQAVVLPRGKAPKESFAELIKTEKSDKNAFAKAMTLARFPQVGALVATASDQQAHEWDEYGHGVFTHELLSGLRGGADVNADQMIEYSELQAFLSAANREVKDPRGKPNILVRTPPLNHRIAIVDLTRQKHGAWLVGNSAHIGHFFIEDGRGNRLIDLHTEKFFSTAVMLPATMNLFIRNREQEAQFTLKEGQRYRFSDLNLRERSSHSRGSLTHAFRNGLFMTPYGPAYYRGFADRNQAVSIESPATKISVQAQPAAKSVRWPAISLFIGASVFATSAAVFGGLALDAKHDYRQTVYQKQAAEAWNRYERWRIVFWIALGTSLTSSIIGSVLYPWRDDRTQKTAWTPLATLYPTGMTVKFHW